MIRNSGVIYRQTLINNRRSIFWWGVGVGTFAFYMVVMYPMIGQMEEILEVLESPIFQFMLGDTAVLNFATLEGFLGVYLFTFLPLMLAVFAVLFGGGIVGREEEKGTFDLLLSTPVARWRVIVEKFGAFIVAALLILVIMLLVAMVALAVTAMPLDMGRLVVAGLNMLPVLMLMCALTVFLTTVLRSSSQAGSIAAVIIAASYFINSFAEMVDSGILKALHYLSFYKYYSPSIVMAEGVQWGNVAMLVGVTVILLALSIYFFARRDIAT
ncbi:ABC transporter permease subunit [Chloroflexota bacterium]